MNYKNLGSEERRTLSLNGAFPMSGHEEEELPGAKVPEKLTKLPV